MRFRQKPHRHGFTAPSSHQTPVFTSLSRLNRVPPLTESWRWTATVSFLFPSCLHFCRECKMKHNCVVVQVTANPFPGALKTWPAAAWRKKAEENRTCVGLAHLSVFDRATYLKEVLKQKTLHTSTVLNSLGGRTTSHRSQESSASLVQTAITADQSNKPSRNNLSKSPRKIYKEKVLFFTAAARASCKELG